MYLHIYCRGGVTGQQRMVLAARSDRQHAKWRETLEACCLKAKLLGNTRAPSRAVMALPEDHQAELLARTRPPARACVGGQDRDGGQSHARTPERSPRTCRPPPQTPPPHMASSAATPSPEADGAHFAADVAATPSAESKSAHFAADVAATPASEFVRAVAGLQRAHDRDTAGTAATPPQRAHERESVAQCHAAVRAQAGGDQDTGEGPGVAGRQRPLERDTSGTAETPPTHCNTLAGERGPAGGVVRGERGPGGTAETPRAHQDRELFLERERVREYRKREKEVEARLRAVAVREGMEKERVRAYLQREKMVCVCVCVCVCL